MLLPLCFGEALTGQGHQEFSIKKKNAFPTFTAGSRVPCYLRD